MSNCSAIIPLTKRRRAAGEARPPKLRSAVTNGTKLFIDGWHEGPWARRFRDLVELHEDDLGSRDSLSEAQRSLCRRVAAIEIQLEQMEGTLSKGEDVDLGLYRDLTGTLARTLTSMGLKRVSVHTRAPTIAELKARHAS